MKLMASGIILIGMVTCRKIQRYMCGILQLHLMEKREIFMHQRMEVL